ncbi:Ig-like domain-containing protein [Microbacterium sp. Leaf151]|uniref:Ig-like domain-containing protein n=1 Tax=Microbacterium sp. Leaf151 TaxID=1736276 RepID=UPI0012E3517E|nr:Ig-like domain-containing protein [Microbacterium sp. Leaf151]
MRDRESTTDSDGRARDLSRRTAIGAAALSVPAIVMVAATPAFAGSTDRRITITLAPTAVRVSESSSVTVRVTNAAGAPLAGQAVSLSASSGVTLGPSSGLTDGSGTFTTRVTPSTAEGTSTITAVSPGAGGTVSAAATLAYGAPVLEVRFSPDPGKGGTRSAVMATLTIHSVAVEGSTISISSSEPRLVFSPSIGTTDAAGTFSSSFVPFPSGTPRSADIFAWSLDYGTAVTVRYVWLTPSN